MGSKDLKASGSSTKQVLVYSGSYSVFMGWGQQARIVNITVESNGNILVIKSNYIGIYNPRAGIMAVVPNEQFDTIEFYTIVNDQLKKIMDDLTYDKSNKNNVQLNNIFNGSLPYISSSGEYLGKPTIKRLEGYDNFQKINNAGLPLSNFSSYDIRIRNESVYQAATSINYKQLLIVMASMGDIFSANKLQLISVKPNYIDKSGYYKNEELISYKTDYNSSSSMFEVEVFQKPSEFTIEINPKTYSLPDKQEGYVLEPSVIITSKKFSIIYPNLKFHNSEIALLFKKIITTENINFVTIDFLFDIINNGNSTLQVKQIALYLGDSIYNKDYSPQIRLLPDTAQSLDIFRKGDAPMRNIKNFDVNRDFTPPEKYLEGVQIKKSIDYINQDMTIIKAKNTKMSLGVSVNYLSNGKESTLYLVKNINFSDVINHN